VQSGWQLPPTASSVKHVMLQEVQQSHAEKSPGAAFETPWYSRFSKEGMFDTVYRGMQATVKVMPFCCHVQVQVGCIPQATFAAPSSTECSCPQFRLKVVLLNKCYTACAAFTLGCLWLA